MAIWSERFQKSNELKVFFTSSKLPLSWNDYKVFVKQIIFQGNVSTSFGTAKLLANNFPTINSKFPNKITMDQNE